MATRRTTSGILPLYGEPLPFLAESRGCRLRDSTGRNYLDFESGVWCAILGHNDSVVAEALGRRLETSLHHGYRFRNEDAEALAEKLSALTALGGGRSAFLSSGSEAVDLALRLARHFTGRRKILRIGNSYLAAYGYGRLGEDNGDRIDIAHDDNGALEDLPFGEIAALALETGGASIDMVRFPEAGFLAELAARVREAGCLIVADEVTTGMGRTGRWFGYQHYGIRPDLVATGKGLGNGYPVSAVTASEEVARFLGDHPLRYAQSHQNDPLGCAVALAVIEGIEARGLVERSRSVGNYFLQSLERLSGTNPSFGSPRGRGLMLALDLLGDREGGEVGDALFEAGFVVGQRNKSLRFLPPLSVEEGMIDSLVAELDRLRA